MRILTSIKMSLIRYRPEVDGLRAVAIIPVLLFHLNPRWLQGGFMGVDVFFVISGYLITSIILAEINAGTFTFRGFWERRVRRIFPALSVMVITILILAYLLHFPQKLFSSLGKQALTMAGMVSNYGMLHLTSDYWAADADLIPLLHTWSLAIEEQFYLFLPAFLFLLFKFGKKNWAFLILVFLTIISFLWCLKTSSQNDGVAFYLLPSRAWELFAGSLLAFIAPHFFEKLPTRLSAWGANLGLVLIVLAYLFIDEKGFPGWKAAIPVFGAFIFIGFSGSGGFTSRLLSSRPFVSVGKVSYSLYLWHWPALVFGKLLADLFENSSIRWIAFALSVLSAVASYFFVESLGKKSKNIWKLSGLIFVVLVIFSMFAVFAHSQTKSKFYAFSSAKDFDAFNRSKYLAEKQLVVNFNDKKIYDKFSILINSSAKTELVVLGDSHALQWGRVIEIICFKFNISGSFWAVSGVPPFLDNSSVPNRMNVSIRSEFNSDKINFILKNKPKIILVIARWDLCFARNEMNRLENLIKNIHEISPQSKVVIFNQPPVLEFGDQYADDWVNWRNFFGLNTESARELNSYNWMKANYYLQNLPELFDYVSLVKIDDIYRTLDHRIKLLDAKNMVYRDEDHLSDYGAMLAEMRIAGAIAPLLLDSTKF